MSRIVITGDTSSAQAALAALQAQMASNIATAQNLVSTTTKINDQGSITSKVTKEIVNANTEVTKSWEVVNGQLRVTETKVKDVTTAMQSLARVQKDLAAQQATGRVFSVTNRPGARLTESGSQDLRNLQSSLANQIANVPGGVSTNTLKQLMSDIESGTAKLQSGPLANVQNSLFKINKLYKDQTDEIGKIGQVTTKTSSATKDWFISIDQVSKRLQFTTYIQLFNLLTSAIKEGIYTARNYQIQISEIRTISQDSQKTFGDWDKTIRGVSDALGLKITDVAEGAYQALSNQVVKSGQAFEFLTSAGKFARTTVASTADSVNLLSSVINSYNYSASEADHISAILFKTIELGRVRASEMANTFGRTSFLASGLGVSLEELSAMIATLTVQGIKYSDSNTLISNVLLKLYKPTDSMRALFKQWGVETGQQAVQMLGFAGVFRKLSEEVNKGNVEITDLFNELRGLKGAEGLINSFDTFEENLKKITNATEDYQKAVSIREESPADYLNKEINKLKNVFVDDIGQELLKTTKIIADFFGGFQKLAIVLTSAASAYLVYRGAMATATAIQLANAAATAAAAAAERLKANAQFASLATTTSGTAATGVNTGVTATNTGAVIVNAGAWRTLGTAMYAVPWLAVAAAIGYVTYELVKTKDATQGVGEAIDLIIDSERKLSELQKNADPNVQNAARNFLTSKNAIKEIGQDTLKALAEMSKLNNSALSNIQANAKVTKDTLQNSFKGFTDGLKSSITDVTKRITEAHTQVKESFKFMSGLKDTIGKTTYDSQFNLANEQQKVQLINRESDRLRKSSQENFNEGLSMQLTNPEEAKAKIEIARKQVQELVQLAEQKNTIVNDINKTQQEQFLQQNPGIAQIPGMNTFVGNTQELRKTLDSIYDTADKNEKKLQNTQAERIKQLEQFRKREEERLSKFDSAYKQFENFSITDKTGKINPEFTDKKTNGVDADKAKQVFQDIADKLKTSGATEKMSLNERIQFTLLLEQRKTQIVAEADALRLQRGLDSEKTRVVKQTELWETALQNNRKTTQDAIAEMKGQGGLLDQTEKLLTQYKEIANRGTFSYSDTLRGQAKDIELAAQNIQGNNTASMEESNRKSAQLKENIQKAQKEIEEIRKGGKLNPITGQFVPTEDELVRLKRLLELIDRQSKSLTGGLKSGEGAVVIGEKGGIPIDENQLKRSVDYNQQQLEERRKTTDKAFQDSQKMAIEAQDFGREITEPLVKRFPQLADAAKVANMAVKSSFEQVRDSIADIITQMDLLQKKMKDMPQRAAPAGNENPEFKAFGGGFPGRPRGQDRVPVWLDPREFVVNADSTSKNFSLLQRINNQPKYMSEGGSVTNVGDVNITIEGGKTSEETVRDIGQRLQRERRRNTIR